jgi:putative beta barrel porin BBP7
LRQTEQTTVLGSESNFELIERGAVKFFAAVVAGISFGMFSAASAADLPVKAPVKAPSAPTWWVDGGALLWSVKSTPLPPTLTTFAAGSPSAATGFGGELGVAGTTVLSPDHLNSGPFGGGRFSIGHWLPADPRFGLEVDGFFLADRSAGFSATSNGTTPLRVPFTNVPPGGGFPIGPSSFVLADPGFASGGQTISSSLQLWGVEGNGLYRAFSGPGLSVSWLAGFRYFDLRENLSIVSIENQFGGVTPGTYTGSDFFSTKNQFFGAQIGVKAQKQLGQFDGSAVAKVALGDNYQTVAINGNSSVVGFGIPTATVPGGLLTQPSNIGSQSRNQFAVLPEAQLQVGYTTSSRIRFFVGYDFIYLSNAVRPGNQIDSTLNLSGNTAINGPAAAFAGAARPQPLLNGSSFWAQGVNIGASYQF